jgi:transposase
MEEVDCAPEQPLADKACDTDAIRHDTKHRGSEPMIPTAASRRRQAMIVKAVYGLRAHVERFFNPTKNSRRVATRYDKLIESFAAFVLFTTIRLLLKFAQTT